MDMQTRITVPSRERTPTPAEQRGAFEKSLSNNLAAHDGVYDSSIDVCSAILPSVHHSSRVTPGDEHPDQDRPSLNMPDSRHPTPDSPRYSGSTSRGRSRSHSQSNLARRFPGRPPFQPTNPHSFSPPSSSAPDAPPPTASAPQHQAFASNPPQFQPPSPYGQAGGYVGQYTVSNPSHMHMVSPGYAYVHHPGYNPQEMPQNTHVGYSSASMAPPSMAPMMQPHMFQYQSDNNSGVPSHSFSIGSTTIYSHANPSPPPAPPPHSAPYAAQASYSQMSFSSPPHFSYPNQPFSSASMYPPVYAQPSYNPQYGSEQEGQGAWWYLPPGAHSGQYENMQPQYHQNHYPMSFPMTSRDMEYSQAGPSSMPPVYSSPTHTQHRPPPQPFEPPGCSSPPPSQHSSQAGGPRQPEAPTSTVSGKERVPNSGPVRRAYHPNPPMQRSEWVMWAGNVPSDATHDELWRFFSQPSPSSSSSDTGVSSIFLISRSNCAFVNFDSEEHLQAAILRFGGQQIRTDDPKCPHLVCRVRRKDDDLRAGVGGQRGVGLHVKWVQQYKGKSPAGIPQVDGQPSPSSGPSSPGSFAPSFGSLSISSDEEGNTYSQNPSTHSTSSGSYASTNSSMLLQYFPKRYFILKSLTQYDLDLSLEKGVWATQRHNEGILDQAFRTSKDVYLIFSVNKSGEFYGCARMCGPISRNETKIPWASRIDSPTSSRSSLQHSPLASRDGLPTQPQNAILSPAEHRFTDNSPLPVTPQSNASDTLPPPRKRQGTNSAPAELHDMHRGLTASTPDHQTSLDYPVAPEAPAPDGDHFELDPNAPLRALKHPPQSVGASHGGLNTISEPRDEADEQVAANLHPNKVEIAKHTPIDDREDDDASWGEPFKIEWIHTDRLPFYRTRHLRNPWNHDREIKVSRDGTELEPSVGKALLEEWDRPEPSPSSPVSSRPLGGGSRQPKTTNRGRRDREVEDG